MKLLAAFGCDINNHQKGFDVHGHVSENYIYLTF